MIGSKRLRAYSPLAESKFQNVTSIKEVNLISSEATRINLYVINPDDEILLWEKKPGEFSTPVVGTPRLRGSLSPLIIKSYVKRMLSRYVPNANPVDLEDPLYDMFELPRPEGGA